MTPEELFIDSLNPNSTYWSIEEIIEFLGLPNKYQDELFGNNVEEVRKNLCSRIGRSVVLKTESSEVSDRSFRYNREESLDSNIEKVTKSKIFYRFTNGIYDARHINSDGTLTWKFYTYDNMPLYIFHSKCQKEFSVEFPMKYAYWRDIKTPYFDKIVKYQFDMFKEGNEMYDFLCTMIGRCLSPISDTWKVTPSLMGKGLGKSTILQMISSLFEQDDIGNITNDANKDLYHLKDKKFIHGFEISSIESTIQNRAFSWTTTMNKICKQETINIPCEWSGASYVQHDWNTPMFLSGQKLFEKGLNKKNLIQFPFLRSVKNYDKIPRLLEEMEKNIPSLLHKFNCAYLEMYNKSKNDISKVAPKYLISSIV